MIKYLTLILLGLLVAPAPAKGFLPPPVMSGPATVVAGTAYTYSYTATGVIAPMWNISPSTSATINSTWASGNTYYASVTWSASGIVVFFDEVEGAYAEKTVTVIGSPATVPGTTCGAGPVTLNATPGAGGDKVRWYTASTGGTYISDNNAYTTSSISSTTTYFVETWSTSASLASARVSVTATYGPVPGNTASVSPATLCGTGTLTLSATPGSSANSIRWYTSPVGGDTVRTGLTFITPSLTEPVTYYAASYATATGCLSTSRTAVLANANPKPPQAFAWSFGPVYVFGSVKLGGVMNRLYRKGDDYGGPGDLVTDGIDTAQYDVRWYASYANAQANTGLLSTGPTFTTPVITQTTKYYVRIRDKETNCYGDSGEGTAIVVPLISNASVKTDLIRVVGKKNDATLTSLTDAEKTTSIAYLDGIGRIQQQVVLRGSTTGKDMVAPMEFDAFGRSSKNYLPFESDSINGSFHSAYKLEQKNFYLNTADKVADDSAAYAMLVYDTSPLGRVVEQGGVGKGYQPGSGHSGQAEYLFNTSGDQVRKFYANGGSAGFYPAQALSKVKSITPDGFHTLTFADGSGNTVLVRQQIAANVEDVYTDYLETYYVYNELGQVNFIISPKGVALLKTKSWVLGDTLKNSYCNQFKYDSKSRVIEKKVPGQAWQYIIYDPLGRVVLTQDGMLKADNKWMFIKYDYKGNAVITGLHTNTTYTTRETLQSYVDGLYKTGHAFGPDVWFEKQGTTLEGYTSQSFPNANIEVFSVNYFDDYDFDNTGAVVNYISAGAGMTGEHTPATYTRGLPTGSKRKILGTSTWLKTYVFYDARGRTIQVQTTNSLNTTSLDRVTNAYADDGRLLYSKKYHNAGTPGTLNVINKYEYTTRGDLWKVSQDNGGTGSAYQLVVQYEYNELGQVVDKKLHHTGSSNFLQSIDYRYTIRGQLKSINNSELASNSSNDETNDYFGMELLYNDSESGLNTVRYDGSITAIKWKSVGAASGAPGQKSYAYAYDKTGRLEMASYSMKDINWDKETGAQNEAMTYDHNGNIKTLERKQRKHQLTGITGSYTNETIDNLEYTYTTGNKNSLEKVTDAASTSAVAGFDNGGSMGNDYTYDANGNLLSDANKGISSIVYNFLGKPTQVNFTGGKKIEYVYDAAGMKLTQKLYNGATLVTTTEYVNGFVYEKAGSGSTVLIFFGSPEGRVVNNSGTLQYEYSIADHQGNTRVVFTSATPSAHVTTVDFEAGTSSSVMNYNVGRTEFDLFDHTDTGISSPDYAQKLTGGNGSQIGVAKSFKVYPGDKLKISAFAKYVIPGSSTGSNLSGFAAALTTAFGVSSSSTGEALKAFNSLNGYGGIVAGGGGSGSSGPPKAFVNILLFDKNFNLLRAAWDQVSSAGEQIGATPTVHDEMMQEVIASEEGYAYVFISNENPVLAEFYIDDISITYTPSNVIQYNEYYPFGLQTSTSWTREATKDNNYLYNAANELNKASGWYEMYYRGYDPAIGRMLQVDPYATLYASSTTYNYALNNPVMLNDPSGGQADVLDRALRSLNRPSSYSASIYRSYGEEWAFSTSSYFIDPIFYNENDYTRGGSMFTQTPEERDAAGGATYGGVGTFWHEIDGSWYGIFVNYNSDGEVTLMSAGLTEGNGGAAIGSLETIYDQDGGTVHAGMGIDISLSLLSIASYAGGVYEDVRAGQIAKQTNSMLKEWQSIRNFNKSYKAGRQATLATNIIKNLNTLDAMKVASRRVIGVGIFLSFVDVAAAKPEDRLAKAGWAAADIVMTGVGLTGWGAPVAGVYFLGRFAYGIYEMASE